MTSTNSSPQSRLSAVSRQINTSSDKTGNMGEDGGVRQVGRLS